MNNLIITEMNKIVESEIKARVDAINSALVEALKAELKIELTCILPENRIEDILYHNEIALIRFKTVKNFSYELASERGVNNESIYNLREAVETFNHVMKMIIAVEDKVKLTSELIK